MIEPKEIRKNVGKEEYLFRVYEKTFICYRVSKKAYGGLVSEGWISYDGDEDLKNKINGCEKRALDRQMRKEMRKQEDLKRRKEMKEKAINELNVGDLLHGSRGYDMTHNDFLQVLDKKGSKVYCKFVRSEVTYGDAGYQGMEKPIKDDVYGEGKRYVISPYGGIRLSECRRAWKCEWDRDFCFNYMD